MHQRQQQRIKAKPDRMYIDSVISIGTRKLVLLSLLGGYSICQTSAGEVQERSSHHVSANNEGEVVFLTNNSLLHRNLQGVEPVPGCYGDLLEADGDGDLSLDSDEYVVYLNIRSGGVIDTPYEELPLSFISNYIFTACQCSLFTEEEDCCVGDKTSIELDPEVSPIVTNSISSFCDLVDDAIIEEGGQIPTVAPTLSPTTAEPSNSPTILEPSESPSMSPTVIDPMPVLTILPTVSPTTAPPSQKPSEAPSLSPTQTPTTTPTLVPTQSPSLSPSTSTPTITPTASPSAATPFPTIEALTCVNFQYGIQNNVGVTADEIFNEINNTLKTGLIIATRNVTIEILNETWPRTEGRLIRQLRKGNSDWQQQKKPSSSFLSSISSWTSSMQKIPIDYENTAEVAPNHQIIDGMSIYRLQDQPFSDMTTLSGTKSSWNYGLDDPRRRLAYLEWHENQAMAFDADGRRLVFYTDDFEPIINAIFDNPFCDKPTPEHECAVVASTVCVVLEEGDDEDEVQEILLDGIEEAILSGEFEEAIPPEHRLSDEEIDP